MMLQKAAPGGLAWVPIVDQIVAKLQQRVNRVLELCVLSRHTPQVYHS